MYSPSMLQEHNHNHHHRHHHLLLLIVLWIGEDTILDHNIQQFRHASSSGVASFLTSC
ncbi:unnamed protein product [Lupinus luteus]|uniref:Uncharacterized protein n=1 Tax=Lupinus luteus TaxID=3873 RepID=A0AAV1XWM5_LUPLU